MESAKDTNLKAGRQQGASLPQALRHTFGNIFLFYIQFFVFEELLVNCGETVCNIITMVLWKIVFEAFNFQDIMNLVADIKQKNNQYSMVSS